MPLGSLEHERFTHEARASSSTRSGRDMEGGKICATRAVVAINEETKADDASAVALLIPRPPHLTGKLAYFQMAASQLMLVIFDKVERTISSKVSSSTDLKHGAVLRLYNSFGMAREFLRMKSDSCADL
jgi:hypothetical protein